MERIPLVKKATFTHFLNLFYELKGSRDLPLLPYAIESSDADFLPQVVFAELLKSLRTLLGDQLFLVTLKKHISKLQESSDQLSFDAMFSESCFNRLHVSKKPLGTFLYLQSVYSAKESTYTRIEEEMFALLVLESLIQDAIYEPHITGFFFTNYDDKLLDTWNGASAATIYFGQANVGIQLSRWDSEFERKIKALNYPAKLTFAQSFQYALEGYIGRQNYSLSEFADVLGIPPRTLQENLQRYGTNFRSIRDQLNVRFAKRVLLQYEISIHDLSIQLGYSAPSQFVRAFKRLTKETPYQWKVRNLN
ncbi:helix-turn-helix transcriptional regulator [Vibrio maritimus]|uniref:helix-turn-helix transcriptional regulator n=1 Tax=Vibrio maritimus TaxID=990268 RepID=UPI001F43A323|nr:helix-turn-helix domain-containing protein [Vibrio maritimus]